MTEREKKDLTILICENLLGFKWYVSDSTGRRGLWNPDLHRFGFTKEATGYESLCNDWDKDLPNFYTPNGLQIVKTALLDKQFAWEVTASAHKYFSAKIYDSTRSCWSAIGDSESEVLLLATKHLLEGQMLIVRKKRMKEIEKAVETACEQVFAERHLHKGLAVNWADLHCTDVVRVNSSDADYYEAIIEEANPNCSELHSLIIEKLKKSGFDTKNLVIKTEW